MKFFKKDYSESKSKGNIANIQENVYTQSERDRQRRFLVHATKRKHTIEFAGCSPGTMEDRAYTFRSTW